MARDEPVEALIDRLELPFNELGIDPYGISKKHLVVAAKALAFLYRHYFRVGCHGIEHVPTRGRAMLVGNHSGGVALDAGMVLTSLLLEMDPPRLGHAMTEKFLARFPIFASWTQRTGQFTGLPEHALMLLQDERLVIAFPEGARGTAKLYPERDSLVDFGPGFLRLALKARAPIVPFAFVGGGDAIPTVTNLYGLGRALGVPYLPVTPWLLPLPLPVQISVHYSPAMHFDGDGNEEESVVDRRVEEVKSRIRELIARARHGGGE